MCSDDERPSTQKAGQHKVGADAQIAELHITEN
jgi:hypothetical protein